MALTHWVSEEKTHILQQATHEDLFLAQNAAYMRLYDENNVTCNVEVIQAVVRKLAHESGMDSTGQARLKAGKELAHLIAWGDLALADERL